VPAAAAPATATPDSELLTVGYDLRVLRQAGVTEMKVLRTMPFAFSDGDDEFPWEGETSSPADAVMELIWSVVAPGEFDYEGRSLEVNDEDLLAVTAPAAVHEDVRAALDFLLATVQRRVRLDVDLWRAAGDAWGPEAPDAAALLAAESDGRLVRVARRHEELVLGRTESRAALTRTRYVRDWEAEIAERSAIAQPMLETLDTGSLLLLRAEEQADGRIALRFVERLSELRSMERRTEGVRRTIHADAATSSEVVCGTLDQPVVAFATLAGSAVLAPGDELVTAAHADTLDGAVNFLVRYRLVSVDAPPAPPVFGGDPARGLRAIELSALQCPALAASAPAPAQYFAGAGQYDQEHVWLHFPSREPRDLGEALERAQSGADLGDTPGSAWQLGSFAILGGPVESVEAARAMLARQLPARRSVQIELELTAAGDAAGPGAIARTTLPLCAGDTGVAVFGTASMLLTGFDVDVANSSSVPDPAVGGCLDGLALRARAGHDGRVSLDLLSHRVLRRELLDLRTPQLMPVDVVDLSVVSLAPSLAADGEWHVQPDIAAGLDGAQLALRWRVTMR
jgi:hypothetical protein